MKFNIFKKINDTLSNNEVNVLIEHNKINGDISSLENYIKKFNKEDNEIIVRDNNEFITILKDDVIEFYSDKAKNYCRTLKSIYEIKSRLYELEKDKDLMRISKSRIVNINHIEKFDLSLVGKIIIKLDDGTKQGVSRRRIGDVLYYLDERKI